MESLRCGSTCLVRDGAPGAKSRKHSQCEIFCTFLLSRAFKPTNQVRKVSRQDESREFFAPPTKTLSTSPSRHCGYMYSDGQINTKGLQRNAVGRQDFDSLMTHAKLGDPRPCWKNERVVSPSIFRNTAANSYSSIVSHAGQ